MTICIVGIAAKARAMVLVADRAVSAVRGGQTVLKADAGVRKIREVVDGWVALISGPIDFGEVVIFDAERRYCAARNPERSFEEMNEAARRAVRGEPPAPLPTLPECAKAAYQAARRNYAVDKILKPRMLTEDWYDEKVKGPISKDDDFFLAISRELDELFTESTILLCGFEEGTPEIYILSDPGLLNSASSEGFGVAGIGEDTAKNRLFTLETDPGDPIEKVLYDAYDAKESCAEFLPDVGHEWNAVVMVDGRSPMEVLEEIKELIEEMYRAHPTSPFDERKRLPPHWRKRLAEFAQAAMSPEETEPTTTIRLRGKAQREQ
jgi:hypothetical protein